MTGLRAEVMRFERPDGGLDLYDPLLDRFHSFDGPPDPEKLASLLLLEGTMAEQIRLRWYQARRQAVPRRVVWPDQSPPTSFFEAARSLEVAAFWKEPEAWRRLTEERLAGRKLLILRGLLPEAQILRAAAADWEWRRMDTPTVSGERATPVVLQNLLMNTDFRRMLGAALGAELPGRLHLNAWRLSPGDCFRVHPDGPRYAATFAIGLNPDWCASDGGAIAFGEPGPEGLQVQERWLPFLGDACFFLPTAESWHVVEPVRRERLTISGWWLLE